MARDIPGFTLKKRTFPGRMLSLVPSSHLQWYDVKHEAEKSLFVYASSYLCPTSLSDYTCLTVDPQLLARCDQPIIIPACTKWIEGYYNTTYISKSQQSTLSAYINDDFLSRLEKCAPGMASIFLCSAILNGCQAERHGLPIMPCHHLCAGNSKHVPTQQTHNYS